MKKSVTLILIWMAAVLALPGSGLTAIIHQDLGGITTQSSEYFDLDGNGTFDIGVVWNYDDWADDTSAEASLPLGAPSDNGFLASGALALKLTAGDAVDGTGNFRSDTVMLSRYWDDWDWDYVSWGNWDGMGEEESAFLGFRFQDDASAFHYGWIQARVDPSTQYITLFDLAWENQAGKVILAGDKGSPVPVPGTFSILAAGLLGLTGRLRKQNFDPLSRRVP